MLIGYINTIIKVSHCLRRIVMNMCTGKDDVLMHHNY